MKILDLLRKLGIVRFGTYKGAYKGTAPTEMIMDDVYDREKDLVTKKDVGKVSRAVKGAVKKAPDGTRRGGKVLRALATAAMVCVGLFVLLAVIGMMGGGDGESVPAKSTAALAVRDRVLARAGIDGSLVPVGDGSFAAGERVHLVLLDVAGFAADAGGKHDFDMSAEVRSPEKTLFHSSSVIGGEVSRELPGGTASAPFVSFDTAGLEPGGYVLVVKVVDKVGGGVATVETPFTISGS